MNLRQELAYQNAYIQTLEAERTQLYKRLGERGAWVKRLRQAHEDALLLCLWWSAYIIPSRRYAMSHGMSDRAWRAAFNLCREARIVRRHHFWIDAEMETMEAMLEAAVKRLAARKTYT